MNAIVADKILYCDAPLRDAVPYLPPILRLQNGRVFFLKISKEIGKAWRKEFYAREARESHLQSTPYLPFYIPFLSEKVDTFYWQMVPLSHNSLKRLLNKSY